MFLDVVHLPYGGGKYKYILTCVDAFSRWPEAFPLERISTKIILQVLQTQVFARFGVPKVIKTDNATYFKSRMWKEVIKFLRIHHPDKIAYRPQSRGVVENFNRYIQDALAKFLHQDQRVIWPDLLPLILLAFRNSTHVATGFSPAQLFLGHPLRTPTDNLIGYPPDKSTTSYSQVFKDCQERLFLYHDLVRRDQRRKQQQESERYAKIVRPISFNEGDSVWYRDPRKARRDRTKLLPVWEQATIVRKYSDAVYRIRLNHKTHLVRAHIDGLFPLRQPSPQIENALGPLPHEQIEGNC